MAVDTVKTRAENVKTSLKDAGYELKDNIVSFISTFGKHLPVENLTKEAKAKEIETEISLLQKEMYPEYMGVKEEDKALLITLAAKLAKLIEANLVDLCLSKAQSPKTIEDEKKILSEVIRLKGAYELGANAKGIKRAQSLETKTLERISLFEKAAKKSAQIRKKIALFQDWANSQPKTSWRNYPIIDKFVWTKQDAELKIAKLNCKLELKALKGLSACPKPLKTQLQNRKLELKALKGLSACPKPLTTQLQKWVRSHLKRVGVSFMNAILRSFTSNGNMSGLEEEL